MTVRTITIAAVTVVALFSAVGSAYYLDAREPRQPYPKATPPPPPSPLFTPSKEPVPDERQIEALARDHNAHVEQAIEGALRARDPLRLEAAFTFLLPELLQLEPERAVGLVARLEPGEARDALRDEIARQWITRDRDATIDWLKSFGDERERAHAVRQAIDALVAIAPEQAGYVAEQFGEVEQTRGRSRASDRG
jgi:hypothetical protein